VRLISAHFVKPFLKSQMNDADGCRGDPENGKRPSMRFVPANLVEQQDLQALHRVRNRMIACRTQLSNRGQRGAAFAFAGGWRTRA
jgi:transposase